MIVKICDTHGELTEKQCTKHVYMNKGGLGATYTCKQCRAVYVKGWTAKNKDKIKVRLKENGYYKKGRKNDD